MKRLFVLFLFLFSVSVFAQATVNFETNGNNWSWILFQPDKAIFDVVANPSVGGLNTTDSCAMLQITDITADPWSGVFSADFPDFTISASNCYVRILVYKDHISNVGLKLEPARTTDYNIPNTVINQWEEIVFDYSAYIGSSAATLVVIPDFSAGPPRPYTSTSYFDQVGFTNVIPVELTSFTASAGDGQVVLNWLTATETNNRIFEIERKEAGNNEFIKIGFVNGHGTTTETQQYSFIDKNVSTRNYIYRLKQIDFDGSYEYSNEVEIYAVSNLTYALDQNYPNPFNPATTIRYTIPEKSLVTIRVFDVLGNQVALLLNDEVEVGLHEINFNAANLSSGVYYYSINAGNFTDSKKLILMK